MTKRWMPRHTCTSFDRLGPRKTGLQHINFALVLRVIQHGKSNKVIAYQLRIYESAVEVHAVFDEELKEKPQRGLRLDQVSYSSVRIACTIS